MNTYEKLIKTAEKGGRYYLDIKKKNLKIENEWIVKEGDVKTENELIEIENEPWDMVEDLYANYKRSVPSSKKEKNKYFITVDVDELDVFELGSNDSRYLAKAKFEGFILLAALSKKMEWKNESHWYWRGAKDRDLVIYKNWID